MASPFGSSNQGGYQGGFGGAQQQSWGGGQGFGGGFQPQQSFGGFGGGGGFGGFGGGGFQPQGFGFGGGFGGGFQQQFNPYQGGFGGFGGFGGGYNPMFGGIGGLGFNPMMGQNFGMPMQEFGGYGDHYRGMSPQTRFEQYDPYRDPDQSQLKQMMAQQVQLQYSPDRANESGMPMPGPTGRHSFDNPRSMDTMYRGGPEMSPEMRQRRAQDMRGVERMVQAPWMPTITETPGFGDWQQKQKQWAEQTPEGTAFKNANEALEAFKKANPNPSSYSGYWADPALKAQYDKIYGDYQSDTQQYFNKLNEYEKTNPFSPTAQQPQSPFTGPQRSAQDILSMAVGKTPQDMQYDMNKDGKITAADALAYQKQYGAQPQQPAPESPGLGRLPYDWEGYGTTQPAVPQRAQQTIADYRRQQPMYGGIGGLGFNPMMGPQFGMPMRGYGGSLSSEPLMPLSPFDDSGMGAENARSARENMRNMSPAQMQNLQSLMQQLQGYGINSPQGQAMLG